MEIRQIGSLIGENVKYYRKEKNYTQQQLADAIFVTQQYISEIERGNRVPQIDILYSLAKILEVNVSKIFPE